MSLSSGGLLKTCTITNKDIANNPDLIILYNLTFREKPPSSWQEKSTHFAKQIYFSHKTDLMGSVDTLHFSDCRLHLLSLFLGNYFSRRKKAELLTKNQI